MRTKEDIEEELKSYWKDADFDRLFKSILIEVLIDVRTNLKNLEVKLTELKDVVKSRT